MFTKIIEPNTPQKAPSHKEGELYKIISAYGVTFKIYYGYYTEEDRQNPNVEPMEMYPSFKENPVYTDEGIPFVTAMQERCIHYDGESDEDATCYQCKCYKKCDELLGICLCKLRRKTNTVHKNQI